MAIHYHPSAVFDCNIFLQAAVRDTGPSFACLAAVEAGLVQLVISPAVIAEIEQVLNRESMQHKFPQLVPKIVDEYISRIIALAVVKNKIPQAFFFPRDPKDEPYINLAIASKVEYLVSRDKDLLDLMDDQSSTGQLFKKDFPSLIILTPVGFLEVLRKNES